MKSKISTFRWQAILLMVAVAAITRLITPAIFNGAANFSPYDAIALYCGAYLSNRLAAFFVPVLAIFFSDVLVNHFYFNGWTLFYDGWYWQYASYALIAGLAQLTLSKKINVLRVGSASMLASLIFFMLSNAGVWIGGHLYPYTVDGFINCYIQALPFFKNTFLGDLFYTGFSFTAIELILKSHTSLTKSVDLMAQRQA